MSRSSIILNIIAFSMALILPTMGNAGGIPHVTNFFKPTNGILLAIQGNDYIVNLDASSGVMVGDLLSIVTPGEKLIDPVNEEVLGSLDTVKGVLKITRIRSGFSQARPLGSISKAQKGDSVRRYQNLTAIFQDQKGAGLDLYAQLVSGLSALEWQGYYSEQGVSESASDYSTEQAELTFVLTDSSLKVHDSAGQIIRSFPISTLSGEPVRPAVLPVDTSSPPVATSMPQPVVAWDQSKEESSGQVKYSVEYPGYLTLGEFPGIVMMSDFSLSDGRQLLVSTDGSDINVYVVTDHMKLIASEKNVNHGQIHAVAWWRTEVDGPLYIAVTASSKTMASSTTDVTNFTSSVYRFSNGQLTLVEHNLPYMLGTFDLDSDGSKETLLAQRFDLDNVSGSIRELKLGNNGLNDVALDFELPLSFPVQGSLLADLTGDGKVETIYTRNGTLYIISDGKLKYESDRQMGGSISSLTYDVNPGQADALFTSVAFEVPQVAVDIDGDGLLELLATSADTSVFSAPGLNPGGGESWLSVLKYQNGRFVKGTLGEKLEKPIQGLTVSQGKAMIVLSQLNSILKEKGQSYLLALPLAQ